MQTLEEIYEEIGKILRVHPESGKATVWTGKGKDALPVQGIGYDRRHKPARVKLETD